VSAWHDHEYIVEETMEGLRDRNVWELVRYENKVSFRNPIDKMLMLTTMNSIGESTMDKAREDPNRYFELMGTLINGVCDKLREKPYISNGNLPLRAANLLALMITTTKDMTLMTEGDPHQDETINASRLFIEPALRAWSEEYGKEVVDAIKELTNYR
jgi:hypothetical protein